MKKVLLGVIMAAVFSLGMLIGTTTVADAVSTDKTTKKLTIIAKQLSNIDKRLEQVLQGLGDPDVPTTTLLQQIRTTAQTIIVRVDQKLPTPVPTPPPDIG